MAVETLQYKEAKRVDRGGVTVWMCQFCSTSKICCSYNTNTTFTKDQYSYRCPKYRGVEERGVLCCIPNSMDFIMSDN